MNRKQKIQAILSGIIIGFVNGFFGGGGGMIAVPILSKVFCLKQKSAHATAIAVILPITVISIIFYFVSGNDIIELNNVIYTAVGVTAGGVLGAVALKKINNGFLSKTFSIIMLVAGVKMLFF